MLILFFSASTTNSSWLVSLFTGIVKLTERKLQQTTIFLKKQSAFPYADTLTLVISFQVCIHSTITCLVMKADKRCLFS